MAPSYNFTSPEYEAAQPQDCSCLPNYLALSTNKETECGRSLLMRIARPRVSAVEAGRREEKAGR